MRSMLAATLVIMAAGVSAQAQTGAVTGVKPKPVTTVPIRPALQTPADTASAMAQAERQAIQSDLAWTGHYNGAINGEVSDRMVAGIKAFQKDRGAKQTGVLNPQERGVLAEGAKKRQDNVGWKIVFDAGTGAMLDSRSMSGFSGGQYLVWTVRGDVRFVVTRTAAANAVVSGIFLDPSIAAPGEAPAR